MSETGAQLTTALSRRIRDPLNGAHDAATVVSILSYCQMLVNAADDVLRGTLTLNAALPLLPFVSMQAVSANLLRISEIRVGGDATTAARGTPLTRIRWHQLAALDPYWLTQRAPRPTSWDMIGQDLLLLWPCWTSPITLAIRRLTPTTLTSGSSTSVPDQHIPMILALAESVLLLRQRLFASVPQAAKRAQQIAQGLAVV